MDLSEEEKAKLREKYRDDVLDFYHKHVKRALVTSEQIDPEQKISAPAFVQVRDAFEHVMRAHGVIEKIAPEGLFTRQDKTPFQYCDDNLSRARQHLQRATYDAWDIIIIALVKEIDAAIGRVSKTTLYTVIPDAQDLISKPYKDARQRIQDIKTSKDAGEGGHPTKYSEWEEAAGLLQNALDVINDNMPKMVLFNDLSNRIEKIIDLVNDCETETGRNGRQVIRARIDDANKVIFDPIVQAKELISEYGGKEINADNFIDFSSRIDSTVDSLNDVLKRMAYYSDEMEKEAKELADKEKPTTKRWIVTTIIALTALVVGVIRLVGASWLDNFKNSDDKEKPEQEVTAPANAKPQKIPDQAEKSALPAPDPVDAEKIPQAESTASTPTKKLNKSQ